MQIQLWSTLKKPRSLLKAGKKAKQRNLQHQLLNPLRWPLTWVWKEQEKKKKAT